MPQVIVIVLSALLFTLILKPLLLVNAYFFFRPLVHPFALEQLKLFSLPINWPFALVVVVSVFPLGLVQRKFRLVQNNTLSLYFLVLLSVVSCAYSINIAASVGQSIKFLSALCLVLVAANAVSSREQVIRIYQGVVFSSIIPMIYGYYQYLTGTGHRVLGEQTDRITSFFGFANLYGIFLALIIFSSLILYIDTNKKRNKVLYSITFMSAAASSILALNRGSWIAIVTGIMLAFPFYRKYLSIKWFVTIFTVLALAASGIMLQRFLELEDPYHDTFGARLSMSQSIIQNAASIPIFGFGAGTAQMALDRMLGIENVPHNDYLRMFVEMGLLGPLLYIILLAKEAIGNLRVRTHSDAWHVNYITLAMIIYWGVISLVQNVVHDAVVFPLFLVCCHLAKKYVSLRGEADEYSR